MTSFTKIFPHPSDGNEQEPLLAETSCAISAGPRQAESCNIDVDQVFDNALEKKASLDPKTWSDRRIKSSFRMAVMIEMRIPSKVIRNTGKYNHGLEGVCHLQ